MKFVLGLLGLLTCQLAGEVLVTLIDLPLPGPVVGFALLFVLLQLRAVADDGAVVSAGDGLLTHLQLLFVPAGVGVVVYLGLLRDEAVPLAVGLVGSWLAGLLVVVAVATGLSRLTGTREGFGDA